MSEDKYGVIIDEFESIISVGDRVCRQLSGMKFEHRHHSYADPIFTKMLCHAVSLYKLTPKINTPSYYDLWDMPSACAIARCIIESYDVLEYISLAEINEEERTFRILVWKVHDKQRRIKMLTCINSKDPNVSLLREEESKFTSEIISHRLFHNLGKYTKDKIKKRDAPLYLMSQKELNAINKVNHNYHIAATTMLSQYVHTLPMSVHQLFEFKAGSADALRLTSLPIQFCLGFLARAISRMADTFANGAVEISEQELQIFVRWKDIVENGVDLERIEGMNAPIVGEV